MIRAAITAIAMTLASMAGAETRVPQSQTEISLGFAPLVKQAAPAVVNIYARYETQVNTNPFAGNPFFEDFFRSFGGSTRPQVQNSLGSGVILSGDGIVVSNYHVVGMATEINVVTTDRREYKARVVLGDEASDLAILKIDDARDLPHLTLRDSDQVEVGELVLAIGNPFGVGQTVSSGIVSGLARSGTAEGNERGYFIQTDAPINPGNSGGALIDVNGSLIGINTSILSRSGGSNGIGFAIPANLVAEFVRQVEAGNEAFVRPWAGIAGQQMDADLAASMGLDFPEGLVISDLHPISPFAIAGFKPGDIVTHVDDQPVNSPSEMMFRMSVAGIGDEPKITRLRRGQQEHVNVKMIVAPNDPPAEEIVLGDRTVLPQTALARINPAVIARYGLPLSAKGVIVLDPGPIGIRAGLKPGDVLNTVNDHKIGSTADARDALTDPGRWVKIDLSRRGQPVSLRFRL